MDVPTGLDGFSGRQRAYVKVQDGCLLRCSYCIIPARSTKTNQSPHFEHIVDEVARLVDGGHHEVVLTGIPPRSLRRRLESQQAQRPMGSAGAFDSHAV